MNNNSFREQIKAYLVNYEIDRKQTVFFAWLCAVRALPFLGGRGHFDYHEEKEIQRYLYAIIRALDASCYYYAWEWKGNDDYLTYIYAAKTANRAYFYAADTARVAYISVAARTVKDKIIADIAAARAAAAYDAATAATIAANFNVDLKSTIIDDIQIIKNSKVMFLGKSKTLRFNNILDLKGKIWTNFKTALAGVGCSYWGDLYEGIYNNYFELSELDKEALERRMKVPNEIQEQGAAAVAAYLVELEQGEVKHLNEARIIILGEKGAGKTCLARRLKTPKAIMTTDKESTAGVDITLWQPEQEDLNIHIWDFAGQTVTHAVHKFFLSERCLYILVYDGRTEGRNRLEYWLSQIKNYGGKSEVFIFINKRDADAPAIPINSLKEKYPIAGNSILSIQDDKNLLNNFRKDVIEYIKNSPSWNNQLIPANYFKVKKKLEQRFAENPKIEYINIDEFNQIAKENEIAEPAVLLKNLHALGICLQYEDMDDFDTLILNPEWISHGIYRIINWVQGKGEYSISVNEFSVIFENDDVRYPKDKYPFLYELMKRYELAYETDGKDCLIIPHLMREDRPVSLPDFYENESLKFRYKAEQTLPPNPISQFIVRHNKEIKKEGEKILVWRHGVVLEDGNGSIALVREWEEEREITVSVKGKDKTAYLDKLRKTLNKIFDDIFKSNESGKPELQYNIIRPEPIPYEKEKPLPAAQIATHVIKQLPFLDPVTEQLIDLKPTVVAFNINIYHNSTNTSYHGRDFKVDNSIQTFNYNNCNIELQGNLNDLACTLRRKGEIEDAEALEDAAGALSQAEQCTTPEEVKKKGIINKLKRIINELEDENSTLYKTIRGIKNGISIAKDIANGYNDIAQWCGLPQVPKLFLKKE